MELATGHAPYANFSLTNIIIMTMHSPVPELERTFSDVSLLFHFSMLRFPLHRCGSRSHTLKPQGCLSTVAYQPPSLILCHDYPSIIPDRVSDGFAASSVPRQI